MTTKAPLHPDFAHLPFRHWARMALKAWRVRMQPDLARSLESVVPVHPRSSGELGLRVRLAGGA